MTHLEKEIHRKDESIHVYIDKIETSIEEHIRRLQGNSYEFSNETREKFNEVSNYIYSMQSDVG